MDQAALDKIVFRLRAQRRDDASTEVKAASTSLNKDTWDSVSAFANTDGGVMIFGLAEEAAFTPTPGFTLDRILDQFVDGMGDANTSGAKVTHPPTYQLNRLTCDGAPVLVIEITENTAVDKPCFVTAKGLGGGSYKRLDDKDVKLSATEVFEFQHVLIDHGADREIAPEATTNDLDGTLVDAFLAGKQTSKALRGTSELPERLARLNITDRNGSVRLAGLLALGTYPQQFFPRLLVDVAVHPANEKSSPGEARRFIDRRQCEGALAEIVDEAVGVIARNLRTQSVVTGTGRQDELEVPPEVLREAVANALLHREYHSLFRGQPVTVDVYPDRIVITNPGGLWGGKTRENLDDGVSRCRNQTLLQVLQDTALAGGGGKTVEGQGGGVQLMIRQMEARALERPLFVTAPDMVQVVLRRHGAEVAENREWLRSLGVEELSRHEETALLLARREGHVSVGMLRDAVHADSDDARARLAGLVRRRVLAERGFEDYHLITASPASPSEVAVLEAIPVGGQVDIQTLAQTTGRTPAALRPILRRLVEKGRIVATAPPTSRHRQYRRTSAVDSEG